VIRQRRAAAFFAGALLATFFAGAFLAATFFAGALLAGAFLAGAAVLALAAPHRLGDQSSDDVRVDVRVRAAVLDVARLSRATCPGMRTDAPRSETP
jgi:hypothetical protein